MLQPALHQDGSSYEYPVKSLPGVADGDDDSSAPHGSDLDQNISHEQQLLQAASAQAGMIAQQVGATTRFSGENITEVWLMVRL